MNWKTVATVAFKIIVALSAGAAVFVSVSKATEKKSESKPVSHDNNNNGAQQQPSFGQEEMYSSNQNQQVEVVKKENVLLNTLKATMNTSSKIFEFSQSLFGVVECAGRIFGNDDSYYPSYHGGGSYGMNGQWTRISPFIVEAGPGNMFGGRVENYNPGYNNNYYPF